MIAAAVLPYFSAAAANCRPYSWRTASGPMYMSIQSLACVFGKGVARGRREIPERARCRRYRRDWSKSPCAAAECALALASEISASSMPYSLALSAIKLAPAPLEVMTNRRPPRGTGWCAANCAAAEKSLHRVGGNNAVLAKRRFVDFAGAGHARGVRHGGNRAALGLADFEHDDGSCRVMGALGEFEKSRAVFEPFHEHGDDFGVVVFEKKFGEVAEIEIHLVAVADHITEALVGLHARDGR